MSKDSEKNTQLLSGHTYLGTHRNSECGVVAWWVIDLSKHQNMKKVVLAGPLGRDINDSSTLSSQWERHTVNINLAQLKWMLENNGLNRFLPMEFIQVNLATS